MIRLMAGMVVGAFVFWLGGESVQAATTATATHTDDPTTLVVRVRLDITAKRSLKRKVFAEACPIFDGVLACVDDSIWRTVRLHRGRNRPTVALEVQALEHGFVPSPDPARPWLYKDLIPTAAGVAYWWFGHDEARPLLPRPVAHDTLVQIDPTQEAP